jgi:MFS family permease
VTATPLATSGTPNVASHSAMVDGSTSVSTALEPRPGAWTASTATSPAGRRGIEGRVVTAPPGGAPGAAGPPTARTPSTATGTSARDHRMRGRESNARARTRAPVRYTDGPVAFIVAVCVFVFANTCSGGAFPALLPDIGRSAALTDVQLGSLAAAFGFARLAGDMPVGLFLTHHLRWAFALASLFLLGGLAAVAGGGPFPLLVAGRLAMGAGHALGMLAALTAVLRHHAGPRLSTYLNAVELSGVAGILAGAGIVSVLPTGLAWHHAFLVACTPLALGAAVAPRIVRRVPGDATAGRRPLFARAAPAAGADDEGPRRSPLVGLAFAAGAVVALVYATMEQFTIPLRGTRELGLDRVGVARLLMLMQTFDVLSLLPVGRLSDRFAPGRVLGVVVVVLAAGAALVSVGGLALVAVGCALVGLGMAGWMLPLAVVRGETSAARIGWRTAVYRLGVDAGIFLGPFAGGFLGAGRARFATLALALVLVVLAVALQRAERARRARARRPAWA